MPDWSRSFGVLRMLLHKKVIAMDEDARERGAPPEQPPASRKPLTPAAQRALAEAAERRAKAEAEQAKASERPAEFQGPKGPEPTRYGDWERKGIASDF
jgi:hypothetical protein